MPRHIVHEAHALLTALLSTSTSMRRWPSIRVIGSIVIRFAILPAVSQSVLLPLRLRRNIHV
jgi:hypothetical protein